MCLENLCSWHKNKVNMVLHIISGLIILYLAAVSNWQWTLGAVVIMAIGHLIQWMSMKKSASAIRIMPRAKRKRR